MSSGFDGKDAPVPAAPADAADDQPAAEAAAAEAADGGNAIDPPEKAEDADAPAVEEPAGEAAQAEPEAAEPEAAEPQADAVEAAPQAEPEKAEPAEAEPAEAEPEEAEPEAAEPQADAPEAAPQAEAEEEKRPYEAAEEYPVADPLPEAEEAPVAEELAIAVPTEYTSQALRDVGPSEAELDYPGADAPLAMALPTEVAPDPEARQAAHQVLQTVLEARQQISDALRAVGDNVKATALESQIVCLEGYASELRKFLDTGESTLGDGLDDAFDPLRPPAEFSNPEVGYMVADLEDIQMPMRGIPASPSASSIPDELPPRHETPEERDAYIDIDRVKRVRRQIVAYKAGRDVGEAADMNMYEDVDFDEDIDELKRVRRQIRYLFGAAPLTVPAVYMPSQPMPAYSGPVKAPELEGITAAPRDLPPVLSHREPGDPTPRSAKSGESYSRSSYSVSGSVGSSEEPRRRRHRHRHRDRDRDREREREREPERPAQSKGDDDWAQEVIKASLDPKNQWDFGDTWGSKSRQPRQGSQQQAQRPGLFDVSDPGEQVFRKAQQRAEEVLRQERARGY